MKHHGFAGYSPQTVAIAVSNGGIRKFGKFVLKQLHSEDLVGEATQSSEAAFKLIDIIAVAAWLRDGLQELLAQAQVHSCVCIYALNTICTPNPDDKCRVWHLIWAYACCMQAFYVICSFAPQLGSILTWHNHAQNFPRPYRPLCALIV